MIRRWLAIAVLAGVLTGTVLALPFFSGRPVIGETKGQIARHWLSCILTSSSALTGTGLTRHAIAEDFNTRGQIALLVLMQGGGLAVLIAGALVGLRFRRYGGWGDPDESNPAVSTRRLIAFTCVLMLVFEAVGTAALYRRHDTAEDGAVSPLLDAIFLSVSAFCNAGLTLGRDSLVGQRESWRPLGVILPLMVAGSIGGPVGYEWWRRLLGRRGAAPPLQRSSGGPGGRERRPSSPEARATLLGTALLLVVGAGLLFFIESTPRWQLRNPRENTPGRIAPGDALMTATSGSAADAQRMRTMPVGRRAAAALFMSGSSRGGGFRTVRVDERSLAPASRFVMMGLMLVGGGLGGTAGGLRIVIVAVLLAAAFKPVVRQDPARAAAIRAAAGAAMAMTLLITATLLVLLYRETGGFEACAFEAVSACCNAGLSAEFTRRLSIEGQVAVILAMLFGRVLPLALPAAVLAPETSR
ncbi:MAG: hypothetical protein HRF43_02695 [Phycisphaerae bacterium]|jgi:Trk-type K+ transport system membrane component